MEEDTDTPILSAQNFTKRTSLTGNYRGAATLSSGNGFEVGKWYSIIASATVGGVGGKAVVKNFRVVAQESVAGHPKVDLAYSAGVAVVNYDGTLAAVTADTDVTFPTTDAAGSSVPDDARYEYAVLRLTGGTGAGQMLFLTTRTGTRKFAFVDAWTPVNPSTDTTYEVVGSWRANATHLAGTAQTARDVGASVLLSVGTGTGQVQLSSGGVRVNWADVLNPSSTVSLSNTTFSTSQAVASVSGAVGSVTGNVGGGVAGDVSGKVLGGGASTITGTGVRAVDSSGNAIAPAATALSTATWTGTRAGYLDNLSGGAVALASGVTVTSVSANAIGPTSFTAATGLQPIRTGTAQAGGASTITLDASASNQTNYYKNAIVYVVSGTGAGQHKVVASYSGGTKVATVDTAWEVAPDSSSVFVLLPMGLSPAVTGLTAADVWGYGGGRTLTGLSGLTVDTVTTLTNDPPGVTTLLSRLGTPSNLGSGATVAANLADIEAQTDDIGTAGAGLTAVPWNAAWDAEVQSECDDALAARGVTAAVTGRIDVALSTLATAAALDTVDNLLDTEVAAIKAQTDQLSFSSGAVVAALGNVAHGGASATLRLGSSSSTPALYVTNSGGDAAQFESTGGNGHAFDLVGQGSGHGLRSTGGATGNGVLAAAGATSGWGMRLVGAGSGPGLQAEGGATGNGFVALSSSTAPGVYVNGTGVAIRLEPGPGSQAVAFAGDTAGLLMEDTAVPLVGAAGIHASSLATDTITAAKLAADAVAEIQSGLSTLTAAGVRAAVGLASANLDTQLAAIDDYVDAEVAAIKAKTDLIPASPASTGDCLTAAGVRSAVGLAAANLDTQLSTVTANQATILGRIGAFTGSGLNTVLGFFRALLRKDSGLVGSDVGGTYDSTTDSLEAKQEADLSQFSALAAYVDTEVAAIKAVTDQLVAAQAEPVAVPAANATPLQKIAWMAMLARNRVTQTATTQSVRNDGDTATVATSTVSDDGTTFVRGKFS